LALALADGVRLRSLATLRPLDEWSEERGPVLWWKLPIDEPPYCGTPLDSDWPGYQTHWTPLVVPGQDEPAPTLTPLRDLVRAAQRSVKYITECGHREGCACAWCGLRDALARALAHPLIAGLLRE
jgi:hypothetical protein